MGYRVSGILKLPDGAPANNAEIEFISRKNFSPLVQEMKSNIKCSATGAYDVTLEYGEYAIVVYPGGTYPAALGTIILAADTVACQDLPTLLQQAGWQPATPEYIKQIAQWLAEANTSASAALASELAAKTSENNAKASEIEVESDRAEVADKSASVDAKHSEVVSKAAIVDTKTAQVIAAESVAVAAADTASQKASDAAGHEAVSLDAATRAENAALSMVGAIIDGGECDLSGGVYPQPVSASGIAHSTVWFVAVGGTVGGVAYDAGDQLRYTTANSGYYFKVDAKDDVYSVNGEKGAVTVTPDKIGAEVSGTASQLITQHETKPSAHPISGVVGLQDALNNSVAATLESLRRSYAEAGYNLVAGSFEAGGTLVNVNDVLLHEASGTVYVWIGALPKVVPPLSYPGTTGGISPSGNWVDVGDASLRLDLIQSKGSLLVGGSSPSVSSFAGLRSSQARYDGDLRTLTGYRAGSIKGAGQFKWVSSSTSPDDGGAVAAVSGVTTGRWVRVMSGPYTPEMYGADGTKANDPDAIYRLLSNKKLIQFLGGKYYYNREFVTNGHTISGVTSETFDVDNTGTHIVFFGNFSANQAYRNEGKKTVLKGIVFEPESWDIVNGYTGIGMRLHRAVDAENCCWNKFKKFGMDLWEGVANAYVPYYSQFRNCSWDYNGYNGIRLAQGANALQIYGGTCRWNGSPAYGVAPVDSSTGWDGLIIGHVVEAGVPAPDNPFATQGLIIEGIDCAYNARYGANLNYCNQSRIHIGYCEGNKQGKDVRIADVIACDINILMSQQGADIAVPTRGYGVPRSDANYPNRIIVNGEYYGSGSKDQHGRYCDYGSHPKKGVVMLATGTAGATYMRARAEGDGSVEFLADGNVQVLYRCPPVAVLPAASEKWLGVIVRNTSSGPNPIQVCVEQASGIYIWRTITTS